MRRHTVSMSLLVLVFSAGAPSGASPQTLELASRGPRFIAAGTALGRGLDASTAVVLRRRVSLDLSNVTADEAIKEITLQADLGISYSKALLPSSRSVSLHVREITVAAALTEVLLDAGVDVAVGRGGQMALVRRLPSTKADVPAADSGAVRGRVTDRATGAPIVGATVIIEGTRRSAMTEFDGRYRLNDVPGGTYSVRVRYIGYAPVAKSVTVGGNSEALVDFTLVKSVQRLDEVVTTGTVVPTEARALPTPVSVITANDIALRRPYDLGEVLREVVPAAVSRKYPTSSPTTTSFSVRGASSFISTGGQMKIFVDGIESADRLHGGVDPSSIERVEVLRGPQAASIYGSNAIGGVVQIFTKRGASDLSGPRVSGEAGWGLVQTPYIGFREVLRQTYSASMYGGGPTTSYHFGATYGRTNPFVPEGQLSNGGVTGGVNFNRGMMSVDLSGRYFVYHAPSVFNPELSESGFSDFAAPYYQTFEEQDQAIGARVSLAPTSWWRHSVTVGVDRNASDMAQVQQRRTFPEDTLLTANNLSQTRTSVGYNTSIYGALNPSVSGMLTLGADYFRFPVSNFYFGGLLRTEGTLAFAPDNEIIEGTRTVTSNSGYFAQAQFGVRDAVFLTAGIRAEQNSNFGDDLGTPLSPRLGLSYVRPLGEVTLKLRGAWGRAIKAPAPGIKFDLQTPTGSRLGNPSLGPERQQGWDGGVDAVFGSRGSLSLTFYDQRADDLISPVIIASTPVRTSQFQNVGKVKNTGLEVEGTLALGPAQLRGQYAYTRSRVEQLALGYTGELRVGDQVIGVPKHTAGASVALALPQGTSLVGGMTYVGSWNDVDWLTFYRCAGGTGPCRNDTFELVDYLITYPGFVKLSATISQRITRIVSGFARVENLTNSQAFESSNYTEVTGRITTIGVRLGN
ncbi:MAG: TonB-dependent receptor [Gemmatimonadales bacterium]|nr:TonB-dependent receptor [Gemmatimonadales bacterium]